MSSKTSRGGKRQKAKTNEYSDIPEAKDFSFIQEFPQLEGSPKQIAWAEQIRGEMAGELLGYTINNSSDGGRLGGNQMLETAQKGPKAIQQEIENNALIKSIYSESLKKEKIAGQINSYKDLSKRIKRLNTLFGHNQAKFWIDNRANQPGNYLNKKFKAMIDGK